MVSTDGLAGASRASPWSRRVAVASRDSPLSGRLAWTSDLSEERRLRNGLPRDATATFPF